MASELSDVLVLVVTVTDDTDALTVTVDSDGVAASAASLGGVDSAVGSSPLTLEAFNGRKN